MEDGHPVVAVLDIPVMTLGGLLAQHVGDRHIDFLSLDIEGLDLVALRTNDWDRYRPDLICTEVSPNAGREAAERPDADVDALLADQGYRLAGLRGANAFYLRSG